MLKSIIVTAIRNLVRNRSFSLINLVGLSVSMSLGLLIILIIREQYTYDNFHQDTDRIYRVNTRAIREGGTEDYASTALPIGTALKEEYTFVEELVRINARLNTDAVYKNVNVPLEGFFADDSFLRVFNFPLISGNPATALKDPDNIVLTNQAAKKIFGDASPIGQTITLSGFGEFTVTGVLADFPSKTHFEFEALASLTSFPALEQRGVFGPTMQNWNNYYSNYVYVKVKEGTDPAELERALAEINKKYYTGLKLETRDRGYTFFTMRLDKITPGPELSNQMGRGMPDLLLIFLSTLAAIVMLMACFNYTNLTVAKALTRAREIGVRKIIGARRYQVFIQFIGEAIVFSVAALILSYLFLQILKPAFLELDLAQEFDTDLKEDMSLYGVFLLFAIVVGILAGLLPAGYLSAFKPAKVLKDSANLKIYSRLTLRKILVVTQFTLSIVFIIVVLVIYRQVNYMVTKDYGINDKDIMNIRLQGANFQRLANELSAIDGVVNVGCVSHQLGTWADRSSDYRKSPEDKPFGMRDFIVDENYVSNLGMKFLSGGNFDPQKEGVIERHVILNEEALKLFGFSDARSAVGQQIFVDDSLALTVSGVVANFHFRPLSYQIGPLALRYNKDGIGFLSARIDPARKDAVVAAVESAWKKVDPVHPLQWNMMADEIDLAYRDAGFFDIVKIVVYIGFLTISLACMGILGMAMYSTQTRVKEIGVRKVMGATSEQITMLLSRSFFVLLLAAAVIGAPIGYYFGAEFLTLYAYKIDLTATLIVEAVLIVGVLGIVMIGSQTWRAASSNPVNALRYE
ncbi:MAG TPA: ABC transporter permease [Chryseosolibacter sp.]|nr:ABC transporter permease [Chryseosolibacter sp.]